MYTYVHGRCAAGRSAYGNSHTIKYEYHTYPLWRAREYFLPHTQYNNVQYYILLFSRNFEGKRMEEKKIYIFLTTGRSMRMAI